MKITDLLLSQDITYNEPVEVTGTLTLDSSKTITLTMNNQNLVVSGKLVSKPIWPAVHTIRFTGVDESKFVGGGEAVLPTDIGLWVMGNGMLDIYGSEKTAWTNAAGGLKAGQTEIVINEAIEWHVGDELTIMPTLKGDFVVEERKIKAITDKVITLDKPLSNPHPVINGIWTAEVGNLTRNVRIEGTPTGKSHTFVMSMMMQNVMYCQFRYMGPRKNSVGDAPKEPVKGRYALHFHHCMDGSAGMCMEGNVARDCDNHAFVTHMSNGICWCDNIVHNAQEIAFWYDVGDHSHGIEYDHNLVSNVSYTPDSYTIEDSTTKSFGTGAFLLGMGDGNSCHDNVAVCIFGKIGIDGSGAFIWMNNNESTWGFFNNMAHNCPNAAINNWQNTAMNHTIEKFTAYYCGLAAHHGAYANDFRFNNCIFFESLLFINAGSLTSLRVRIENSTIIGAGFGYGDYKDIQAGIIQVGSPVDTIKDSQPPNLYRNLKFLNINGKPEIALLGGESAHDADIVDCNITNLVVKGQEDARVQQGGKAYLQNASGKKDIPLFAPSNFGTGDGVLIEYFSDTNFKNKVAEIIQPQANFTEWKNLGGPHHLCPGSNYSIRVSGQWQPQYTDSYTFSYSMDAGGAIELRVENVLITKPIAVKEWQKYNFELRFKSTGSQIAGFAFNCNCPAMQPWHKGGETIPQSQLYSPQAPANQAPVANAGSDLTITLPINSAVLNGSGSDADGVIVAYKWTGKGTIVDSDKPICRLSDLVEGDYVYTLQVTDDKGATATDTVTVHVLPAPPPPKNEPPVVTAAASVTVVRTGTIFLNGGADDPEKLPMTFKWTQIPVATGVIKNADQLNAVAENWLGGTYKFNFEVTDSAGNKVSKEVTATI